MTQTLTCVHAKAANLFQVQFLKESDIQSALDLISMIKNSGTLNQPHHLKDRDIAELRQLHAEGYPMLGIKNELGQLIAFATVSDTGSHDGTLIIRSLCTNPTYKGYGLGKKLVTTATEWMIEQSGTQIMAKVAADNHASLSVFLKTGFSSLPIEWDNSNHYWYYMMTKNSPYTKHATLSNTNYHLKVADFQ